MCVLHSLHWFEDSCEFLSPFLPIVQAHPWFKGIQWDRLYQMEAAFIPEVNDELDTQNFEKFEEVVSYISAVLLI